MNFVIKTEEEFGISARIGFKKNDLNTNTADKDEKKAKSFVLSNLQRKILGGKLADKIRQYHLINSNT